MKEMLGSLKGESSFLVSPFPFSEEHDDESDSCHMEHVPPLGATCHMCTKKLGLSFFFESEP